MAPNEMQWSIKWWLGLPLTLKGEVCAYCPDKALDAHHAVTCKFGGDVVARYKTLRNVIFEFCKRALLNPKLEAGAGLGHERRLTRPSDISFQAGPLVMPAAIDVSITSPLKSSILSEAGVVAGAAARQTEERKHTSNDPICSELGWTCVPLVVETCGAWGRTTGQFFAQLAVTICGTRKFHKGYHAEFHVWQIESLEPTPVLSSQGHTTPKQWTCVRVRGLFCAWSFVIICICI